MKFQALDVETANEDIGSICQIGIASFVDGVVVEEWSSLIDPECEFSTFNIYIHGITPEMVRGKPRFSDVAETLRKYLENEVTVCHTHFDRVALRRDLERYRLPPIETTWLDTARVTRRTWKEFSFSGYGLQNVCDKIGYRYRAHDALEDAKAAGQVLLAAIQESKADLASWLVRVNHPIHPGSAHWESIQRDGNPEGDLNGEVVVFTGTLHETRSVAADRAASAGCRVDSVVTKKTTILVLGDPIQAHRAGHQKSSKNVRAEELAANGYPIRIIRETDFYAIVESAHTPRLPPQTARAQVALETRIGN